MLQNVLAQNNFNIHVPISLNILNKKNFILVFGMLHPKTER